MAIKSPNQPLFVILCSPLDQNNQRRLLYEKKYEIQATECSCSRQHFCRTDRWFGWPAGHFYPGSLRVSYGAPDGSRRFFGCQSVFCPLRLSDSGYKPQGTGTFRLLCGKFLLEADCPDLSCVDPGCLCHPVCSAVPGPGCPAGRSVRGVEYLQREQ